MWKRWLTPRSMLLHLAVLIVAPGCLIAGWWQMTVALSGNYLSFVYTVEWPVFAVLAVVMWWQLINEDPGQIRERKQKRGSGESSSPSERLAPEEVTSQVATGDDELDAYNGYLASLAARGRSKTWRDPWGDR